MKILMVAATSFLLFVLPSTPSFSMQSEGESGRQWIASAGSGACYTGASKTCVWWSKGLDNGVEFKWMTIISRPIELGNSSVSTSNGEFLNVSIKVKTERDLAGSGTGGTFSGNEFALDPDTAAVRNEFDISVSQRIGPHTERLINRQINYERYERLVRNQMAGMFRGNPGRPIPSDLLIMDFKYMRKPW